MVFDSSIFSGHTYLFLIVLNIFWEAKRKSTKRTAEYLILTYRIILNVQERFDLFLVKLKIRVCFSSCFFFF